MSSLSHSMTWRSTMLAGSIGTMSASWSLVSTNPPGCCDIWRGNPISSRASSSVMRSRRSAVLRLSASACFCSTPSADQPHTCPASAAVTSSVRPSTLPTSRTAPRAR